MSAYILLQVIFIAAWMACYAMFFRSRRRGGDGLPWLIAELAVLCLILGSVAGRAL